MYSSILSLTSALDEGGWLASRSSRFSPGKDAVPLYRRLGETQGPSGRVQKILSSPGFVPRIVQPVASRCTD